MRQEMTGRPALLSAAAMAAILFSPHGVQADDGVKTLCRAEEKVFFSCPVKNNKIISLCGPETLTRDKGYLQYRYGRNGRMDIEYPAGEKDTLSKFRYGHYSNQEIERTRVNFSNNEYSYEVFTTTGKKTGIALKKSGVIVNYHSMDIENVCLSEPVSRLDDLGKILTCDRSVYDCPKE